MLCPKCSFQQPDGAAECARCGLVFAKLGQAPRDPAARTTERLARLPAARQQAIPQAAAARPAAQADDEAGLPIGLAAERDDASAAGADGLDLVADEPVRLDWKSLGIGLALAAVVLSLPWLSFILHPLITLVHELGHTVFAWLFGFPAIPKFDLLYGGGLTHMAGRRSPMVVVLVLGLIGGGLYHARRNRAGVVAWLLVLAVYLVLLRKADRLLITYMGHGFTLLMAGVFLYRGAGGGHANFPAERALWAFIGFFALLWELWLGYALLTDPSARLVYGEGKPSCGPHDFVRIGKLLRVHLKLVARFHLGFTVMVLPLSLAVARLRRPLGQAVRRVLGAEVG